MQTKIHSIGPNTILGPMLWIEELQTQLLGMSANRSPAQAIV